ncbi:TerD family protein [Gordonia jinghuaiqii]|nr:TerD family protein [Gordonia jinghuaiqii]
MLVDVETSGLSSRQHRILSLSAIAVDANGGIEGKYSSLFNPGCDPGPVHIHRLTPERLHGAPTFDKAVPRLHELLQGRTLVAHNAGFDHGFLVEEARRADVDLPITHRLCTVTLARRLQLNVANVKLGTLARHWNVPKYAAHDAADDVRTLLEVFRRSVDLADALGLQLPVVACGSTARAYPDKVTRVPCPWTDPGRYNAVSGLVQGTKVVITGPTSTPRLELARRLSDAGLDVMNGLSGRTGLLIANSGAPTSRKLQRARELGIPAIDEATVLSLASRVVPGALKAVSVVEIISAPGTNRHSTSPQTLPWSGRRILVLGGTHAESTTMRSRFVQLGTAPAINLTAGVTHVLLLDGGEKDPRLAKAGRRGLPILEARHVDGVSKSDTPDPAEVEAGHGRNAAELPGAATMLSPGAVMDVPSDVTTFTVNVAWSAGGSGSIHEVDVVGFELGLDEKVPSDDEFVFYNQPASPDGAVRLSNGDREQGISVNLSAVDDEIQKITIGAAIDGETFGDVGALSVTVDTADFTLATAVLDAATTERSMIIVELYRRDGNWRLRALGQGYDDGLAEFAVRHGVDVEE